MLAYVFWHAPAGDREPYEAGMSAFHAALRDDPPPGFGTSYTLVLPAPPWFDHAGEVYLDVYTVDDFADLGRLNDAAVSGSRQAPHDAVAARAARGAGGVMRLLHGSAQPQRHICFLDKPTGLAYEELTAALEPLGESVWMRQMTLGPGPEFWVLAADAPALPWPARHAEARVIRSASE